MSKISSIRCYEDDGGDGDDSNQYENESKKQKRRSSSSSLLLDNNGDDDGQPNHNAMFTIYPDSQTGLIDREEFLSKYETYQVIYLPKILSNCYHHPQPTTTNETCNDNDDGKKTKDSDTIAKENTTTDIKKDTDIDMGVDNKKDTHRDDNSKKEKFTWRDISELFSTLNDEDQSSWTEEKFTNKATTKNNEKDQVVQLDESKEEKKILEPGAFLSPSNANTVQKRERGYSSFLVQHDKEAMGKLLKSLPFIQLPINKHEKQNDQNEEQLHGEQEEQQQPQLMRMKYGPCLWFFYGRNDAIINQENSQKESHRQKPLDGRPEHTDSISHHGTWHYQLSGIKEWHLKPTEELLKHMQTDDSITKEQLEFWSDDKENRNLTPVASEEIDSNNHNTSQNRKRITVSCQEGDVLLVNTRLWWHSTTIPEQPIGRNKDYHPKRSVPSVSYARDIYLKWEEDDDNDNDDDIICDSGNMTNLDGLYASNDIDAGTIIFTEDDMPDCELHRTKTDPNCEVTQLETGGGAVIACRAIKAGEFFCLLESDDEDEDEDEIGSGSDFEEEIDSDCYE